VPTWVFGVGGGLAAGVVLAVVVAIRGAGGGSGSSESNFPDPSADIALGVASQAGTPSTPTAVATPPPTVVAPTTPQPLLATTNAPPAASPAPAVSAPLPAPAPTPVVNNTRPATVAATSTPPPASAAPTPSPGTPLTTAQIVAKWEPSIALVKGLASSGTGFLVRPGIVATNSHVIDDEFVSSLEVRFPSAPEGKQGPYLAELLYEDPKRDLAFLKVVSDLPAIDVAPSYKFMKGEDITVIGNPGLGEDVVLENAISRGVMSSKVDLEGQHYLQLSIAVNPGNSGGPVFDSTGRVIGVVTLKSTKTEAMAFCVPVEEFQSAIGKLGPARPDAVSNHRARVAFQVLTAAGALRAIGLEIRAGLLRQTPQGARPNLLPNEGIQKIDEAIKTLDEKLFTVVDSEIELMRSDTVLNPGARGRYQELWASYKSMKNLYSNTKGTAAQYTSQVRDLRAKYIRLVEALQKDIQMPVPEQILALLKTTLLDGQQSQAVVAQAMPGSMQSRILRNRSRVIQRGAPGQRPGAAPSPAQSARDRMQDLRDRMRNRGRPGN
jgi:serine protease Do